MLQIFFFLLVKIWNKKKKTVDTSLLIKSLLCMVMTFLLLLHLHANSSLEYMDMKTFIQDEILPMVQAKNLTLAFSSESSIEEELKRESTADAITILVSLSSAIWNLLVYLCLCVCFFKIRLRCPLFTERKLENLLVNDVALIF